MSRGPHTRPLVQSSKRLSSIRPTRALTMLRHLRAHPLVVRIPFIFRVCVPRVILEVDLFVLFATCESSQLYQHLD